jgi:hypothetical protein
MKLFLVMFWSVMAVTTAYSRIPHLDLEMTSGEYRSALQSRDDGEGNSELDPIIKMGKRFFDWMKLVNDNRPKDKKISISNPQTQPAYPIESPRVSNPKLILGAFSKLKEELPADIKVVVLGGSAQTIDPPVSDEEFIYWGMKIDDIYGRASRWLLQEPWLWGYASKKQTDVRGFYFLSKVSNLEGELNNWSELPEESKTQYFKWLVNLCLNGGGSEERCSDKLSEIINKERSPLSFYQEHLKDGQARWDELFRISEKRDDIQWTGSSLSLLKTPFVKPDSSEIEDFLKVNIEDEWKWGDWALNLNFIDGGYNTTHVEFIPGATPHVNGLAGSTITMDANQPITEYHVKWTIRHEFGHTLGFPDCYVEFYDTNTREMISYQIDTSNLMCSRRGKLQDKHYQELKRVYYTPSK